MMPFAVGGDPLQGDRRMRFVYSDESGASFNAPDLVTCGVIVDADRQLVALEDHLETIMEKHIPEADWGSFYFHAADIWNGNGYFEDCWTWPWARREPVLWDLVNTPEKFQLPVILGFQRRATFSHEDLPTNLTKADKEILVHVIAFLHMTVLTEQMVAQKWPGEVVQLIAEDRAEVRSAIAEVHKILRDKRLVREGLLGIGADSFVEHLPLRRIRNPVHFVLKDQSWPLQLADACAYFFRGYMAGNKRHIPFYAEVRKSMVIRPVEEIWPPVTSSEGEKR